MSEAKKTTELKQRIVNKLMMTNHSATIEAKICKTSLFTYKTLGLRQPQKAAINRLRDGLPVWHKISDSAVGSKPCDVLFLNPVATVPYILVIFSKTNGSYLIPAVDIGNNWTYLETDLTEYKI